MAVQTRVQAQRLLGLVGCLALGCGGSSGDDAPDGGGSNVQADASSSAGADAAVSPDSGGGGGGGGSGLDISGFPAEEETAISSCAGLLPADVADGDLTITRDNVDQGNCPDPIGLTSADLDAECGFADLQINAGQSTLGLRDALMIDHPDFLCYVVAGALSDLWIRDNIAAAMVGYHSSFGVASGARCYACPPDDQAGCEARDAVPEGQTRDSRLRARIDLREAMVATFADTWPYDSVRWADDGDSACSGTARQEWVGSIVVDGGAMDYTVVDLDVEGECGQSGKSVRIQFTPDSNGGSLSVNSIAFMDPRDAVQFYEPGAPAGAGETWGRTHGAAAMDYVSRAIYWADGAFTAAISNCNY